jgi:hypothetical protein
VASALRPVFAVAVIVGIASTVVAWRLPERPLREHTAFDGPDTEAAAGPPAAVVPTEG